MPISFDEFCLNSQDELNRVAGENGNPLMKRTKTGFIDALRSPENTQGVQIIDMLDKGDGKTHRAQVKYLKPDGTSDAGDTITDICDDAGTAKAYTYDEPEITLQVQSDPSLLTESQMRELCESGSEFRIKLMNGAMDSIITRMNQRLIPLFVAGAGKFNGGDAGPNSYAFLNNDSGIIQPDLNGEVYMMRDYDNSGASGRPIVVGDGNIDHYRRLQKYGCCNGVGLDNNQIADFDFYYDRFMNGILSNASEDNMFFVWAPRAAQLLTKTINKGEFAKSGSDFTYGTITDPMTGIEFDMELQYDKCSPRGYRFKMSLRYDLWQLPLDMFKSTDTDRYQVNYNFLFAATIG